MSRQTRSLANLWLRRLCGDHAVVYEACSPTTSLRFAPFIRQHSLLFTYYEGACSIHRFLANLGSRCVTTA
eukprot:3532889-Pleurochrysis_carterae.AAC.1